MHPWFVDLRHDLIKHALFAARDLSAASSKGDRGDAAHLYKGLAKLLDNEGNQVSASTLFLSFRKRLVEDYPSLPPSAEEVLDAFAAAVADAEEAAACATEDPDRFPEALHKVLALEQSFSVLAQDLVLE